MSILQQKHGTIISDMVFDAYNRMSREQLVLFLTVRSLPTDGDDKVLVSRLANHDFRTYTFPYNDDLHNVALETDLSNGGGEGEQAFSKLALPLKEEVEGADEHASPSTPVRQFPEIPTEIMVEIVDHLGDWELARAVGLPTSLPRPSEWATASPADEAILCGHIPSIRAVNFIAHPATALSADVIVRFGYLHVLDLLLYGHRNLFLRLFADDFIPTRASHYGRTSVLAWWKRALDVYGLPKPRAGAIAEAMDGASRLGQVNSLNWWVKSGLQLEYTEAAMESASAKNQLHVLDWWKASGLVLKIGRVMDVASSAGHIDVLSWWAHSGLELKYDKTSMHHASMHGRVDVLDWWAASGLQLIFDQDVLVVATKHNHPEVLEWWDRSGLPVQYRMFDIEEALEDAIGDGDAVREWWRKKGVDFRTNNAEWMKVQTLN